MSVPKGERHPIQRNSATTSSPRPLPLFPAPS
jgi:hypothetical protein